MDSVINNQTWLVSKNQVNTRRAISLNMCRLTYNLVETVQCTQWKKFWKFSFLLLFKNNSFSCNTINLYHISQTDSLCTGWKIPWWQNNFTMDNFSPNNFPQIKMSWTAAAGQSPRRTTDPQITSSTNLYSKKVHLLLTHYFHLIHLYSLVSFDENYSMFFLWKKLCVNIKTWLQA